MPLAPCGRGRAPHDYSARAERAGAGARSRSGSRRLLPFVLTPDYLVLASQIAITGLFALSLDLILGFSGIVSLGHAAYFGVGAYTAGLISVWGWGEPLTGLVDRRLRRRHGWLRHELRHRALSPSRADHDHARHSACCCRRPRTAPAGSPAASTACKAFTPGRSSAEIRLRSLWLHRLRLFARRVVPHFPGGAAAHSFAVRAGAARHPRERRAHAGDRRADALAYPHHLHHRRHHRRHRRRHADRRPPRRSRSKPWASSARPTCWSC